MERIKESGVQVSFYQFDNGDAAALSISGFSVAVSVNQFCNAAAL
jgi:hypothetical protein